MASPKKQRKNPQTVSPKAPKIAKATARDWISGARIQTLPLAFAPVALGTAAAYVLPHEEDGTGWHWLRALLCLVVAVSLQIGVNFANDYSDGVRGTDDHRLRVPLDRARSSLSPLSGLASLLLRGSSL